MRFGSTPWPQHWFFSQKHPHGVESLSRKTFYNSNSGRGLSIFILLPTAKINLESFGHSALAEPQHPSGVFEPRLHTCVGRNGYFLCSFRRVHEIKLELTDLSSYNDRYCTSLKVSLRCRMNLNQLNPNRALYLRIRAAFVVQDTTLGAWCRENGVAPQNAVHCITGVWGGPKGRKLRTRIIAAAGIAEPSTERACPNASPDDTGTSRAEF